MASIPVEEQLGFDISGALTGIQTISDALTQVVTDFSVGLSQALETLTSLGTSATPLAESLDVAGLGPAVETALTDATSTPQTVTVDGDTADLTGSIDTATSVTPIVDVGADTTLAQGEIDSLSTAPVTVDVDADTSGAQNALDELGVSATSATGGRGGGGLAGLEGAVLGVEAATGAAQGEVSGLTGAIGGMSSGLGAAVAGGVAFTAFIGKTVSLAADAQAQQARFNQVFGDSAEIVKSIDVGGLTTDLETLGRQSGTTTADLEASASRIGALGAASHAAQPEVAKTASDLLGLAGALSVANPRLGDTATVADTISRALATGRTRSLIPYGISVSQVAIQQKALHDNIGSTAATLTGYQKLVAGLTLALEQQGSTLGTKYAQGIQGAEIQLRALKVSIEETLVAIGGPLLAPVTDSLKSLLPVAKEVGLVLGELARVVLPALTIVADGLGILSAPLGLVADGLGFLADAGTPASIAIVAVGVAAAASQAPFFGAAAAAEAFGVALDIATGPIGIVVAGLAALGIAAHLAGGDAQQAAVDTSALDSAFQSTSDSGATLSSTLGGVTAAVDKYLHKQLEAGHAGDTQIEAANNLGATYTDLRTGITGTTDDYSRLINRLSAASPTFTDLDTTAGKLFLTLESGRDTLQTNAEIALETAVSTGVLTDKQLKAAEASHQLSSEEAAEFAVKFDAITVLREFGPLIDAQTQSTNASALAAAQASPAYAELVGKLASGAITVDTFASSLTDFGFTADVSATFAKNLQAAIQGIVSTSVGALPKASDAISTYASTAKADLDKVNQAVAGHEAGVGLLFAKLVQDTDPSKFVDNLLKQAQAINDFTTNLAKISAVAPELAIQLGEAGPVAAGQLAAGFASAPAKAKAGEGALSLVDAVTSKFDASVTERAAQFEASGAKGATSVLAGLATGITDGAPAVGDAAALAAAQVSARFNPEFGHRVTTQFQAAANALAADGTVSQAAGQKGLEALAAFQQTFGPVSAANAVRIAVQGAHDAIQKDPTLAAASGKKGDDTSAAFKPKIDAATKKAFDQAAIIIPQLTNIATAAGTAGHAVGVAFDTGMVQGIDGRQQEVIDAAVRVAAAAEEAARRRLESKSPSQVGVRIGRDFSAGIAIGLSDTTGVASAGVQLASTVASSAALTNLGATVTSSVVAGFNDPATVDAAVKRLQELVAKAAKDAAATAQQAAASSFASGLISALPDAGTAISTFGQNVGQAAAAQTAAFAEVHKAYQQYADDQRERRALEQQLVPATEALHAAQVRLFNDTAGGANKFTLGIDKDQVKQAQKAVDDLQRKLTTTTASIGNDQTNIATGSKTLTDAVAGLATASNPATFVKNLRAQTAANEQFQANLRKLIRQGDTDLAEQLAQAGPSVAGKLAASLASKPALAKAAEAAVDQATAFSKSYQTFLEKQFAPEVHALAGKIGTDTGTALNAGISVNGIPTAIASQQTVSVAGAPPVNAAAQLAAFQAAQGPQTLDLNLAIELPDGTILNAQHTVKLPATLAEVQRVKARTKAAVIA